MTAGFLVMPFFPGLARWLILGRHLVVLNSFYLTCIEATMLMGTLETLEMVLYAWH